MANDAFAPGAFFKSAKGTARIKRLDRRADRRDAEQAVMHAAKVRDGHKCRWPGCTGRYRGLPLRIEAAHELHRAMGGNPSGDRTTLPLLVTLCERHHDQWDDALIAIEPVTDAGFNGPAAFYLIDKETGAKAHVVSERSIGISEPRRP